MKLEVLISCMHQDDTSIVERTNISSDALIVNQCDKNDYVELLYKGKHMVRMISTTERGLSRSRNMAIKNSTGDICLICDDDEILNDDYNENIIKAYNENPTIDSIIFSIAQKRKLPKKSYKINYLNALKVGSVQISFRKDAVIKRNILFDTSFGSGTGNGGGEENIFLYDCLKYKMKIIYLPIVIGIIIHGESNWFHGFTPDYFKNRGKVTKRYMGGFFAFLYVFYFTFTKYNLYKKESSVSSAIKFQLMGIFY